MLELSQAPVVSDDLVRRLTELDLCSPADFKLARACVRRLAHDLPAFDSVWIDALVQLRRLTPYQSRILDGGHADQLRIGPYVIVEKLGHGPHGTTLLAKLLGRNELHVLKRLEVVPEVIPDCRVRLHQMSDQTNGWSHPHLVVPRLMESAQQQLLIVISHHIPGLTLAELLVRRGRFPHRVVVDIARQLASGLAGLQTLGLTHGDIRMANVKLTSNGSAVLVDGALRPAICPEMTIHDTLALEAYDGTAPELIGTGTEPNAASDTYALGCLLWQLLTGRPPFPMADPLMKLAAHQTQRIADVRTWAPSTPADVAETIFSMTSPIPNERPKSFEEVLSFWGRPGMASRSRLRHYRKSFDGAVPHFAEHSEGVVGTRSWPWIAACLFIAVGAAWTFADRGMKNQVLAIPHRFTQSMHALPSNSSARSVSPSTTDPGVHPEGPEDQLRPFPDVSADGEIVLSEEYTYDVADVVFAGSLTIRGTQGKNATIRVGRKALRLAAASVSLINVNVVCDDIDASSSLRSMIFVQSSNLLIQECGLQRVVPEAGSGRNERPILAWTPTEGVATPSDNARQINLKNSVFQTRGPAILFVEAPASLKVSNCLKVGGGACFAIHYKAAPHPIRAELTRLTLRDSGPLLRIGGAIAEQDDAPEIEVATESCVFAMTSNDDGLVQFVTSKPKDNLKHAIRMTGQESIFSESLKMMVTLDPLHPDETISVSGGDEQFEGLMPSEEMKFQGPISGPIGNSELIRISAPHSTLPGVRVNQLPSLRVR